MKNLKIILAQPRGFCAGVDRAISFVNEALAKYGRPIYVKHEIVHNQQVVDRLCKKGAIFTEDLLQIPVGARVIFSAHGVSPQVRQAAMDRGLQILDATCPLVTKVHREAQKYSKKNHQIVLIGHHEHVEVQGTVGHAVGNIWVVANEQEVNNLKLNPNQPIAYITQTTLSLDDTKNIIAALRKKYPNIASPSKDDICYATQNRQNAVKQLCKQVDLLLVVGASNSSNTMRLVEVAQGQKITTYRIETALDFQSKWLDSVQNVGITAGASAPEDIVQSLVKYLRSLHPNAVIEELKTVEENTVFPLPKQLRAS